MTPRSLAWIAQATSGRLVGEDRLVEAIATDTRALPQGRDALFVALKGGNFDGHDHVATAALGGCVAALVSREVEASIPQVVVADSERALGDFAAAVQRERATKVLAITGSNGKTSVKALLLSILGRVGGAYANPGNRNNEIGLPLAVLDAPDDARFAVYEMGAGKPGDIAYLTAIARPDVALVNNIAPAHLQRMGSLLGVADTKAAIYDALADDGVAVVNADDAFAPYFLARAQGRRSVRFGLEASAEISARGIDGDGEGSRFVLVAPAGEVAVALPMPGRHNVRNALAAAAMAPAPPSGRCVTVSTTCSRWRGAWFRIACAMARCWSTTATTPTRVRWMPPSTPLPQAATKPGWCWATCANSAPTKSRCTRRPACVRRRPGCPGCSRWAA